MFNKIQLLHLTLLTPLPFNKDNPSLVVEVLPRLPLLALLCIRPPQLRAEEDDMLHILVCLATPSALLSILFPNVSEPASQVSLARSAMGIPGGYIMAWPRWHGHVATLSLYHCLDMSWPRAYVIVDIMSSTLMLNDILTDTSNVENKTPA